MLNQPAKKQKKINKYISSLFKIYTKKGISKEIPYI